MCVLFFFKYLVIKVLTFFSGFGKCQYLVTCVGGLSLFSYIIGVNDVSYILPAAECDFNLTAHDKGSIQSLCFIGM